MKIFSFLLFIFVFTTLTELYLIIAISQKIGWEKTIGWTLLTGIAGSWLARQEGRKTFANIRAEMAQMRVPASSLIDAGLILFSGGLLITPGFLTDAVGFSLLIPVTRAGYRKLLMNWFKSKFQSNRFYQSSAFQGNRANTFEAGEDSWNDVVQGEVVQDDSDSDDQDIIDVDVID